MSQPDAPTRNAWAGYTGDMIVLHALRAWADLDTFMDHMSLALYELEIENRDNAGVQSLLYAAIEARINTERLELLQNHYDKQFGGQENVTPEAIQALNLSLDEVHKLYAVQAFYKIPRVFMGLYVHAHILHYLDQFETSDFSWLHEKSQAFLMSLYEGVETTPDPE